MTIIIYSNALIIGCQMTKTHLCNQICSLSSLSALCIYFHFSTDTENGGNITFQFHFPLEDEKKKTADNCQESLHLNLHSSKIIFAKRY